MAGGATPGTCYQGTGLHTGKTRNICHGLPATGTKLTLPQTLRSVYRVPCPWVDRQQNTAGLPREPIVLAAPPEPDEKLLPRRAPPQGCPAPAHHSHFPCTHPGPNRPPGLLGGARATAHCIILAPLPGASLHQPQTW